MTAPNRPSFVLENVSLAENTYYKMGGIARYFAIPKTFLDVQSILHWTKKHNLPCAVIGSGSNSVFSDELFPGVVISLGSLCHWHWESPEFLFVEAGVTNTEVSEICAAASRAGASWMYRMPGQIGASVRMNARCYGGEMSQIAHQILSIDLDGHLKTWQARDFFLGYKKTVLMAHPEIIVGVRFHLPSVADTQSLLKHMSECQSDRHLKNHFYLPSCGSTFKNSYSVGIPSGQIFDQLGFKGKSVGQAEVSATHANFIWNKGHATSTDMLSLAASMRKEALCQLNADLELEVQPIGLFENQLYQDCAMERLGHSQKTKDNAWWVGLLNADQSMAKSFPQEIFASPFFSYHRNPKSHLFRLVAKLVQLTDLKSARKNPTAPFLAWRVFCDDDLNHVFAFLPDHMGSDGFMDHLWQYSVAEIFFAHPVKKNTHYFEFEVTPKGQWIALEFNGTRQRTSANPSANKSLWHGVFVQQSRIESAGNNNVTNTFGMDFSFAQLESLIHDNEILLQCALSLGNDSYFLSPMWSVAESEKPDFHQPTRYWSVALF